MQFDRDDCSMEHLQATHETHGALWNITPLARAQDVLLVKRHVQYVAYVG